MTCHRHHTQTTTRLPLLWGCLIGISLCVVIATASANSLVGTDSLVVDTRIGLFRGLATTSNESEVVSLAFLGIPYAAPTPRWQVPSPPASFVQDGETIFDATSFGAACPGLGTPVGVNENCHFLNIYAPAVVLENRSLDPGGTTSTEIRDDLGQGLPVILFIHGGGFVGGTSSSPLYDGTPFEQATDGNVLLVTINYRLGPLGFLFLEGTEGAGVFGLLDQRAAMKWVHENIAAFGGNPNNITIVGESAGGISVCLHMVMPESWDFFKGAIIQSGNCLTLKQSNARTQASGFASRLNCSITDLECLNSKSISEIAAAGQPDTSASSLKPWENILLWFPVNDGNHIPDDPLKLLAQGKHNKVPVIAGTVENEASYFDATIPANVGEFAYRLLVMGWLGADLAPFVFSLWPPSPLPRDSLIQLLADYVFTCATRRVLTRLASSSPDNSVFGYRFTHIPECSKTVTSGGYKGAFHGVDILFTFRNPPSECTLTSDEIQLSDSMMSMWANHAISGNPESPLATGKKVVWRQFQGEDESDIYLNITLPDNMRLITGIHRCRCDLLDLFEEGKLPDMTPDYFIRCATADDSGELVSSGASVFPISSPAWRATFTTTLQHHQRILIAGLVLVMTLATLF